MHTAIDVLKFAAGLLATVLVITLGIWLWNSGASTAKVFGNKQTQYSYDLENSDKTRYDGLVVNGADVVNAINRLKSDGIKLTVIVKVKDGENVLEKTISDFSNFINLPSNELYINPCAKFVGKVSQNENGVISGLSFTQKDYVAKAIASTDDDYDAGTGGSGSTNADIQQSLESFTSVANDLTVAVSGLQQAITNMEVSGGSNNGGSSSDINVLKDTISSLSTTVNGIKQFCDEFDFNHNVDLSSISSQLEQIQTNLSQLTVNTGMSPGDVQSAIDNSQTIVSLLTAVSDLSTTLNALSDEMGNVKLTLSGEVAEDGTVTTGLIDDVADLQGQVDSLSAQLADMKEMLDYLVSVVGGD